MPKRLSHLALVLSVAFLLGSGPATAPACPAAQDKDKSEASEKKKKEKTSASERGQEANTRKVLSRVLRDFKNDFEGLSSSAVMDSIEADKFYDFPRFEEGVTTFLRAAGEMRLYLREVNVQVEEDRAVMIVDGEMRFAARDDISRRGQRRTQVTFDFERTPQGWKITEINPRSFFLPD